MSAKIFGLLAIIIGIIIELVRFFIIKLPEDIVLLWGGIVWIAAGIIMLLFYAFLTPR